jgi:alkylresorcinol/alkylpyrone synthase
MATLLSLERYLPPYRYEQETVTSWAREWLESPDRSPRHEREGDGRAAARLLSAFSTAGVTTRASVVPIEDVFHPGDFETQNRKYREIACRAATEVASRALAAAALAPSDVRMLVSVSCTGFMIPAVDAYVANALGLGPRLVRLPITEAGCAGGVVGLARAADYLAAHPGHAALLLSLELSSLTFQRWDRSAANVVSTAIFGDGGAAAVLVGPGHPRADSGLVRVLDADAVFFPGTTRMMGFELRNEGLQIRLDKGLAAFVRREVAPAVDGFLAARGVSRSEISCFILHPGGRKIVEAMADRLGLGPRDLAATEAVLAQHGNMSSVTVLFVLDEVLRHCRPGAGSLGLLGAFGPGFAAELALLEFP